MAQAARALAGILLAAAFLVAVGCGGGGKKDDPRAGILSDLSSSVPETRIAAAVQLGQLREKAAVPALIERLKDIRLDVRKAAATALGAIGDARAVQPLCAVVADETADRDLRRLSADALGAIRDPGAVQALASALNMDDAGVSSSAAYALGNIGEASLAALCDAVAKGPPHARRAAAAALGSIPADRSREAVRGLLDAGDPLLRLAAAESAGRLADTSQAERVAGLLLDPNETVRLGVRSVLPKLGIPVAPALVAILREKTDAVERTNETGKTVRVSLGPVRKVAREMLAGFEGVAAIPPVVMAIAAGGEGESLRSNLVRRLASAECRAELLRVCANEGPAERAVAIRALSGFLESKYAPDTPVAKRREAIAAAGCADIEESVAAFAKGVGDADPPVRYAASLALCRLGDPAGRPAVLAEVRRSIAEVKAARAAAEGKKDAAVEEPASLGESLDALLPVADRSLAGELLPALDEPLGEQALTKLVRIVAGTGDPAYADRLIPLLKRARGFGPDSLGPSVSLALGAMGAKQAYDPIAAYMRGLPNDNFFASHLVPVYEGLFGCDTERACDEVGKRMVAMKPHIVTQIEGMARSFGRHPSKSGVLPVVHWINHDIQSTANEVSKALVSIGRRDLGWLVAGFEIEDGAKRRALAGLISDEFATNAMPHVLKAATDGSPRMRQGAVWVLGRLGGPEAVAAVRAALKDEHPAVRSAAAWSAGAIGDASLVEPLVALLADKDLTVRSMAAQQAGNLNDARANKPLIAALDDPEAEVRGYAAISLGKLKALEALPAIERLLNDKHPDVQTAAGVAVNAMKERKPGR